MKTFLDNEKSVNKLKIFFNNPRIRIDIKHEIDVLKNTNNSKRDLGVDKVKKAERRNNALINCENCGKEISKKSLECPKCGTIRKNKKGKTNNGYCLLGFLLGLLGMIFYFILPVLPFLAIILSSKGLGKYDQNINKNKWMGYVGLSLGIVYTVQIFIKSALLNLYG